MSFHQSASIVVQKPAPFAVDLYGDGNVGKALLARLKQEGIPVANVFNSRGRQVSHPVAESNRVFVDAITPYYSGPASEKWIAQLETTLERGIPVVTCNKAPLALEWKRILRAAQKGDTVLACSATVGGGTPILYLLRRLQLSHGVVKLEASLSGTLSFVLSRVAQGTTLSVAVQEAQRLGYAEPDPTLDLDGTDAYAKAVILHNQLFPQTTPFSLKDRKERLDLKEKEIQRLVRDGLVPQVVAHITPGSLTLQLEGRPTETALPSSPVDACVRATGRDGSRITLAGPGAGPGVTAGALLGDLLALRDRPQSLGWGVLP